MANRDVDGGAPSDLPARGGRVSERSAGRRVGAAGAADPTSAAWRTTAQDQHAGGDECHPVPAAHWLPVALPAARQLSAALDGLQHLSQVSARWCLGGDLGRVAHGLARGNGPRGQPIGWVLFSWFGRNRRLAKDFENLAETLATFVTLASIQLALRRLARVAALTPVK